MSNNILGVSEDNFSHAFSDTGKTFTNEKLSEKLYSPSNRLKKKKKLYLDPKYKHGRWTDKEHKDFILGILKLGKNNWKKLEDEIPSRNSTQIRSHAQKYLVKLLKKHNILNHKRSAYVSKELLHRIDIDPREKYIIEVLNNYRRKMNFINSLKTNKIDGVDGNSNSKLNQINDESRKIFLQKFCNIDLPLQDSNDYLLNNKIFNLNYIRNYTLENEKSIVSSIENLMNINSRFINNLYENRNHYNFDCIQKNIDQLFCDFGMQLN